MLGKGHLVITIEPKQGERYQGVVGLEGDTLAQVLEGYFERSEQLKTRLWIRVGKHDGKACAAGMLLQIVPDGKGSAEDFEHLEQLTNTIKDEELLRCQQKSCCIVFTTKRRCNCSHHNRSASVVAAHVNAVLPRL